MKLSINHNSPIPLHAQVEELLRKLTQDPEHIKGKPLPKEVDLAKVLGVARNTIRQATNKLVYEGILIRKKGVGTFVAPKNVTTRLDNWDSFTQEMNEQGIRLKNYELRSSFISSEGKTARNLGIDEGREILCLERLKGNEEGPFVYFISYFHPRIGLTGKENFNLPLYDILENDYSTIPETSREEIQAITADKTIAEKLSIDEGAPILFRKRTVLDPGSRIIEYNLCYYRGDKFAYSIDIKRGL